MINGLIFDCDGTLADTMPLHWRAWNAVTSKHKLHFPEERFYAMGGIPSRDILKLLRDEQGLDIDPLALAHEKEQEYLRIMHEITVIDEVVAIVRGHHGQIPMAVASGGNQTIICSVLEQLGIRQCFSAVVTSEMVQNQKPAPDIFLEAARRIGVEPGCCRAYEDTDIGLAAIRAAGMEAVDVRTLRCRSKLSPAALSR